MKIGFIAMSGIRVVNQELLEAGLTLPGFVERGKVIASMPSLSLLTLASLTPDHIEVQYHEIADIDGDASIPTDFDLVAISTFSAQAKEAYAVADRFRATGVTVVMGGIHVTALPDEAKQHCDAVVVGEGEVTWPELIRDFEAGELKPVYSASGIEYDLASSPEPRYDLLQPDKYNRFPVQTQRGCPWKCDFCASSILLTRKYKTKPVKKVIEEIRRVKEVCDSPFIEFADDNTFVDKRHSRDLVSALILEEIKWFTETDVGVAKDEELLRLMRESGCAQVLIGFESPSERALGGIETIQDWKRKQLDHYKRAIETIQSYGITVNGCFVLGLDGDGPEIFDEVLQFSRETGLYDVQVTVMTPFPGTPLYDRLLSEGRIIDPGAWEKCTLFDVNFVPNGMSVEQLEEGIKYMALQLGDPVEVRRRRQSFRDLLKRSTAWRRTEATVGAD